MVNLKTCGIILTLIDWSKLLMLPFNLGLFSYQLVMLSAGKLLSKIDATWPEIWRAAQICHIRLVLNADGLCISFTAPIAKLEQWNIPEINNAKYHFYKEPTFEVSDEEALCLLEAAQRKVGDKTARGYDYLQLFSFIVNLIIWLFWWPVWGKEINETFNLPHNRQVCSTGIASLLENNISIFGGRLFDPFDTAMISPCLFSISKYWSGQNNV